MIVGLMLLAALAGAAQRQARVLTGSVSDTSGMALAGAEVDVVCGGRRGSTVADAAGHFSIEGVPVERCVVVAAHEGFHPSRQVVDLRDPDEGAVNLRLGVRQFSSQVLVTPGRGVEEESARIPQGTSVVSRAELDARPYTAVTQAFKEEPGVLAQQTTASQGSPILRGFTGQRNLYLLDGIRYNTAAWRDGPSQYLAWLPVAELDHAEIVRGPGSALYGSDAMGGAVALFSVMPGLGTSPRVLASGGVAVGGANTLRGADGMVGLERHRLSLQLGASAASSSDLRPGGEVDSHAAVTRFLGLPSSAIGPVLEQTGFDQVAGFGAVRAAMGGGVLTASYRHATQSGAHRYDQELGGNGRYLSAFEPQALDFGLVRVTLPINAWVDALSASVSVNRQADGRREQARPAARIDAQSNTTTAIGYQVQATRAFSPRAEATFGADVYDEYIAGERTLIEPSGAVSPARPDIPDGTRYTSLGAYWQQTADLIPGRLTVRGGLRFGRFAFGSREDAAFGVPEEHVVTTDTTFNAAAVVVLSPSVNATLSVSRGFRAANAFDFGGIGLSGGAGFEIAPSRAVSLGGERGSTDGATALGTGEAIGTLGPEALLAYEAGLRWQSGRVSGSATVFDLELHDQIERRTVIFPGTVVGEDLAGYAIVRQDAVGRAYVAGEARPIVSRVNVSRARVVGLEAHLDLRVTSALTARAWASAASGKEIEAGRPLRRMPPVLGGASARWQAAARRWWVEATLLAAAAQHRLSDGDLGDARIGATRTPSSIAGFFNGTATDRGLVRDGRLVATGETLAQVQARVLGGAALLPLYTETPGFAVLGLRAGVALGSRAEAILVAENLADSNHRLHGSGVDEPGVNATLRLRLKF